MSRRTFICVAILALSAILLLTVVRRQPKDAVSHGEPLSNLASAEKPYISYNFPRIPLEQFLDEYEYLAGKKVTLQAKLYRSQTVRVITVRPLTKSEALTLCEEVLKEQEGLIIVHEKDGSLRAERR